MCRHRRIAIALVVLGALAHPVAAQTAPSAPSTGATTGDDGKLAFNNHCRNCHSAEAGDNRLGPTVFGIFGKEAGQNKDYTGYSGSLKGFSWDEATLDKFIANPTSVAPSTTMNYPPVGDPAIRKQIIGYLKTLK